MVVHVAPAAAVFVAHAPVVEYVCIVGRVRGASAHRMRSASASGRVHFARPAVFVAPAPVVSTLREGCSGLPCPWRQLQPHPQHQRQWQSTDPVRRPLPARDVAAKSEGHTVRAADVKTAFFHAQMKDGDVVHARPPLEWQLETLGSQQGFRDLESTEESVCSEKGSKMLAGPSGGYSQKVRFGLKHA